jgi:protocatechuate 3,4-dioxygenase beta subunit
MKTTVAFLFAGALSLAFVVAKPFGQRRGTDILHWHVTAKMVNPGFITNVIPAVTNVLDGVPNIVDAVTNITDVSSARGKVEIKLNQQGKADIQQFKLDTGGLVASNQYSLLVLLAGDTNFTLVGTFTTDGYGKGKVEYKRVGQAQSKGKGKGGPPHYLPTVMDPLTDLREVAVANTNNDVVLFADLTRPDHLHYLVKGNFTNDGVDPDAAAQLHLHANKVRTQINIKASGLEATNSAYQLALNSNVAATVSTDKRGRANFKTTLTGSYPILDLTTIQLLDGNTNSVLSIQIP